MQEVMNGTSDDRDEVEAKTANSMKHFGGKLATSMEARIQIQRVLLYLDPLPLHLAHPLPFRRQ